MDLVRLKTRCLPGSRSPAEYPKLRFTAMFRVHLALGAHPPFSPFLTAVLDHYGVQFGHLSPGTVCYLSVFAHLCGMFVGVRPSVALFRHYFSMQMSNSSLVWGVCRLVVQQDCYISHPAMDKWEGWKNDSFFMEIVDADSRYDLPIGPPAHGEQWRRQQALDSRMQVTIDKIRELGRRGLTHRMVILDFLRRRIAPLLDNECEAWSYLGEADCMRLRVGRAVDEDFLRFWMKVLTGDDNLESARLPDGVVALADDVAARTRALAEQPKYNYAGLACEAEPEKKRSAKATSSSENKRRRYVAPHSSSSSDERAGGTAVSMTEEELGYGSPEGSPRYHVQKQQVPEDDRELAERSQALRHQVQDWEKRLEALQAREMSASQLEEANRQAAAVLAEKEKDLEVRAATLVKQEEELGLRASTLAERENAVGAREAGVEAAASMKLKLEQLEKEKAELELDVTQVGDHLRRIFLRMKAAIEEAELGTVKPVEEQWNTAAHYAFRLEEAVALLEDLPERVKSAALAASRESAEDIVRGVLAIIRSRIPTLDLEQVALGVDPARLDEATAVVGPAAEVLLQYLCPKDVGDACREGSGDPKGKIVASSSAAPPPEDDDCLPDPSTAAGEERRG